MLLGIFKAQLLADLLVLLLLVFLPVHACLLSLLPPAVKLVANQFLQVLTLQDVELQLCEMLDLSQ